MILFAFHSPDAVPAQTITDAGTENDQFCSCGRNRKIRTKSYIAHPLRDRKGRSCLCSIAKRKCTAKCKCIGCGNKNSAKDTQYRCGAGKRNGDNSTSCHDKLGGRKTKCPCFSQGRACGYKCRCFNCINDFGVRILSTSGKRRAQKITSGSPSSKRKRCSEYLECAGFEVELRSWTSWETCILNSIESFISSACIPPTIENIQKLFNFVAKNLTSHEKRVANVKSLNQVRAKLQHKKEREEAIRGFLGAVKSSA